MRAARSFVVDDEGDGARADAFVAKALGMSQREARGLFAQGAVTRGGRKVAKGDPVRSGDVVDVVPPSPWLVTAPAELAVVYEDAAVVVVDKPAGVPSHPLVRGEGGTVADALAVRFPECARASQEEREGGLVHRLDTFTSGLLAAARTRAAWEALREAFGAGQVERGYLALVHGALDDDLELTAPIAHDPSDARRMLSLGEGELRFRGEARPARTLARPVSRGSGFTLVALRAHGGRRHQVRVHLAGAGFPLVGDELYGGTAVPERQGHLLHAALLGLPDRPRLWSAPPPDFLAAMAAPGVGAEGARDRLAELFAP